MYHVNLDGLPNWDEHGLIPKNRQIQIYLTHTSGLSNTLVMNNNTLSQDALNCAEPVKQRRIILP